MGSLLQHPQDLNDSIALVRWHLIEKRLHTPTACSAQSFSGVVSTFGQQQEHAATIALRHLPSNPATINHARNDPAYRALGETEKVDEFHLTKRTPLEFDESMCLGNSSIEATRRPVGTM
jgi:hypothetical protein